MRITITTDKQALGLAAAEYTSTLIRQAIQQRDAARILVSTGTSQNETVDALVEMDLDWSKVEIFHLDEYIGLPASHAASFRKYLKDRIIDAVHPGKFHYVSVEGDIQANIRKLSEEIGSAPIDVGLIGIGENAHIAFNDPPADFDTDEAYIVVKLDQACRQQQVGEGWFNELDDVPEQAVSVSVKQIMACKHIISCVPDRRKAKAVRLAMTNEVSNQIPATILKQHANWTLFLDVYSASELDFSQYV